MNNIDLAYITEFEGRKIDIRNLYEQVKLIYTKNQKEYNLKINKSDEYSIEIIKDDEDLYKMTYNNKIFYLKELIINFEINNNKYSHPIYDKNNLLLILKHYHFLQPYINMSNKKIYINMISLNNDLNPLKNNTIIYDDFLQNQSNIYFIPKDEYEWERNLKKEKYYLDLDDNKIKIKANFLGKYVTNYIKEIKNDEQLLYFKNDLLDQFQLGMTFFDAFKGLETFNFLTGPGKSGKTFSLLSLNLLEKEENYRVYLNDRYMTELESQTKNEEIIKIIFYEISKIFHTYEDYINFSKTFLEKIFSDKTNSICFKKIVLKFLEQMDLFLEKNGQKYKKLILILDEYILDEEDPQKFKINYDFMNELCEKRVNNNKIQITFLSPLNDNYMKNCVLFSLDLKENKIYNWSPKKDNLTGKMLYPFTYYYSCFCDPNDESGKYKELILDKNKEDLNIPKVYLEKINYSIYHLNNIKNKCEEKSDAKAIEIKANEYIINLQKLCDEKVNEFFQKYEGYYVFNNEILKKYHELINKDYIKYEELIEIIKYMPIEFINFYMLRKNLGESPIEHEFKVLYSYTFIGDLISKFIFNFQNTDYEEDKELKPGQKGDILEEKVIESIKNGYFKNFRPDETISINSIYKLTQYNNDDKNAKNIYSEEIKTFQNVFNKEGINLIMVTQLNPSAKKYDIAFIQKYKDGKYQFIFGQITRYKPNTELYQYQCIKNDCYGFANFFLIFKNIEIKKYHFIFVFQAGDEKKKKTMFEFCDKNNLKYIKFTIENKKPIFYDSDNKIIKDIIFNKKSYSMVDLVKNYNKKNADDSSSSSEYSLIGQKRAKISKFAKTQYSIGSNLYNKVLKILNCKKFELSKKYHLLKEDEYFYICLIENKDDKKLYYLMYLKGNKKIIECIFNDDNLNNKKITEKYLSEKDAEFKCFRIIE